MNVSFSSSSSCRFDLEFDSFSHFNFPGLTFLILFLFMNVICYVSGGNVASYGTGSAETKDRTLMAGLAGWGGGSGSGVVGRTMKEYEDLLGSLQKENFNLKLRIYFLEEQGGISRADQDVVKKNIELNVSSNVLYKNIFSTKYIKIYEIIL